MQEKLFNRILTVVIILSIVAFAAGCVYVLLSESGLTLRKFAAVWLFAYVLAVTLGFKGSIESHKDGLTRFAVEWLIACGAGTILAGLVIMFG
ncbi:MAG: hypothetical protein WED05_02975 [Candidatus Atabeyarchaeum deiterrae]